jgi:hypothetical protein
MLLDLVGFVSIPGIGYLGGWTMPGILFFTVVIVPMFETPRFGSSVFF